MKLIEGDLIRVNTKGFSDFDGNFGIILSVDEQWYATSHIEFLCKIFFPINNDIRYYATSNLEKLS